jgi:histidinol-phosphate phosphatase family protein
VDGVTPAIDVVIPTIGRPSLARLLHALGPDLPHRVIVVDDRRVAAHPLDLGAPTGRPVVEVLRGSTRGPAAARNVGWRAAAAPWVELLDDDVVPAAGWLDDLHRDIDGSDGSVAGNKGRVRVPLPEHRRPTDWERNVAGLERAQWITADIAYRRAALAEVGGFDERFPRAYREDTDLALRVTGGGHRILEGARMVLHPVGPAPWHVSIGKQRGNADDALMDRVHGTDWRARAGAPPGALRFHMAMSALAVTAAGLGALAAARRESRPASRAAAVLATAWVVGTGAFASKRIAPGPRTRQEVTAMIVTSAALPPAAVVHRFAGAHRASSLVASADRVRPRPPPAAVLVDRDGTIIHDVAYNADPARVTPLDGARDGLDRLRAAGIPVAIISNQSGVGRGLLRAGDVDAVNAAVDARLGPFDGIFSCLHAPEEGCGCRKPQPGLLLDAAAALAVDPAECAVIGDIGADVAAGLAIGARAIMVPTAHTRADEVAVAPEVAASFEHAVALLVGGWA